MTFSEHDRPIEPAPAAVEDLQFPIGDIHLENALGALVILDDLQNSDYFLKTLNSLRNTGQRSTWVPYSTAEGLTRLSKIWGGVLLEDNIRGGQAMANTSLFSAVGIMLEVLPAVHNDFSKELETLAFADPPVIQSMSDQAWATMQDSHKNVYGIMAPFCSILIDRMYAHSDEERRLIHATTVLPYLLSSNSALMDQSRRTKDVSRIVETTGD